jgi:cellulose synthase operon protein YhjQ
VERANVIEGFPRLAPAKFAEGLKGNGGGGGEAIQARYEGTKQAVWQRLQDALSMPPKPDVPLYDDLLAPPPPLVADKQQESTRADRDYLAQFARTSSGSEERTAWPKSPQTESNLATESQYGAMREINSFPTRSSWVTTGFEERRILVTPPPAELTVPEPQHAEVLEELSAQAPPSWMPAEEATAAPIQEHEAAREETTVQAPTWTPDKDLEGKMWKSATYEDTAVSTAEPLKDETPQVVQEHEQDASRWFVLKSVLGGATVPQETSSAAPAASVPVLEVFSLAGGVGKTSLVATLGRALSARGERVLLVEATPFGSLQYFFGACDCRPGVLRTFRPPSSSTDAPIRLATIDPDAPEAGSQGLIAAEIEGWSRGASRVIVDAATRSTATARGLSRMSPVILVPLFPDVNSVLTANSIDSFFQRQVGARSSQSDVYYILNQFDPSLPLHVEVRKVLRERLGERLLPFTLQRTPAISEALAEGMTIMDYAPDSAVASDFTNLAKWVESVMAPADMNSRGARWSER